MKAICTIQNVNESNQDNFCSMDGEIMLAREFKKLIDQIIRENATYRNGCFSLFASDLPLYDKRLLLSYLIPIDEYEECLKDSTKEVIAFKENEKGMQFLINERIDNVWHETMQEMNMNLCHCRQTGESYYR